MIGTIFRHLEEFGNKTLGADIWKSVLMEVPLVTKGVFERQESYSDSDLTLMLEALAKKTGWEIADAWRKFGESSTARFLQMHSELIDKYASPQELLNSLNDMHYVGVKNLYEKASPPYFYKQNAPDNMLITRYFSKRKLCFYLEGGLESLAKHYESPIKFKQLTCQHNGCEYCDFEITFSA
jgi:predicted hydrocarbon binding protein